MARRITLSMPAVDPVLDHAERSLIDRALAWLREARPRDSGVLWGQIKRLALIGEVLEQTPSLFLPSTLGGRTRDDQTLVAALSRLDPLDGELRLPEKAVVSRAFLMAKISLLRAFLVALGPGAPGEHLELADEFRAELAQSIHTAIATELLLGILPDPSVRPETKARASHQLILIWDGAAKVEIDDFCPMLESAWCARSRVTACFGALLGTGEYMRLVQEDCSSDFLEFFTRDGVTGDEVQAFEEFLFNLTHEELVALRTLMKQESRRVVDAEFVGRVLGRSPDGITSVDDPTELYRSYHRRRSAAEYRRLLRAPGPLRVAEAHIMIYILETARSAQG
jgi:hypothetical protein